MENVKNSICQNFIYLANFKCKYNERNNRVCEIRQQQENNLNGRNVGFNNIDFYGLHICR